MAAKAEEKKLELLFLRWSEHHRKLGNFQRCNLMASFICYAGIVFSLDLTIFFLAQVISNFGPQVSIFTILLRQR